MDVILSPIRISEMNQLVQDAVRIALIEWAKSFNPSKPNEVMDITDLMEMTGYKRGYINKMVHFHTIPCHKPTDGKLFFLRSEIMEWIRSGRRATRNEITKAVNDNFKK